MKYEEIAETLKEYLEDDPYVEDAVTENGGVIVHTDFEEGGRWHNFEISVAKFVDLLGDPFEDPVFVRLTRQVAATEYQENGSIFIERVTPKEVTTIQYFRDKESKEYEVDRW